MNKINEMRTDPSPLLARSFENELFHYAKNQTNDHHHYIVGGCFTIDKWKSSPLIFLLANLPNTQG
ncbi:hypothetical protein AB9G86_23925 [Escherichia coli]|uniref:hypothetical protein n=1 Tax=Escherichia coli TaxID=562 RepID=UPI0035197CC7